MCPCRSLEKALKISSLVAWLFGLLLSITASAAPSALHCDSCDIQVRSLDQPVKLTGGWLFTRDDLPTNKDANADTSKWVVVKAPGPWKHAYSVPSMLKRLAASPSPLPVRIGTNLGYRFYAHNLPRFANCDWMST